ncbi:MAG: dTDP-4-dehydrorhamnose reductase [Candidatus Acidiferrum sp.]
MTAILLTGKNGQVGADLELLLPPLGNLVALDRSQLDLSDPREIRRIVRQVHPRIIVNAAAYTVVDRAETEEKVAHAVNADAPAILADEARKIGAILVHYSTDYVFDGLKQNPYEENDPTNPLNAYGRTKLAGEIAIRQSGVAHLIFRISWVYATRGRNFLLTLLRLASQRKELRIVRDQTGTPNWSREIARATVSVLHNVSQESSLLSSLEGVSGTYHMTAPGATTWFEFAQAISDEASRASTDTPWVSAATGGRPLMVQRIDPITSAEYPTPAVRPLNSLLSSERLFHTFGVRLPDWRVQLHNAFDNTQA